MKFSQFNLSALLLIGILFIASCTPDEPEVEPEPEPEPAKTGTVTLELEHVFDGDAFTIGNDYTTANGDVVIPSKFQYYISNISLSSEDNNTTYKVPNSYYIIDIEKTESLEIALENIPNGEYTKVIFTIGVDSTANVSGAQDGALDVTHGLFWSWNMGYIFLKLEGTTQNTTELRYHIGGFRWNANNIRTREVNVPAGSMINVNGSNSQVHFMVNVAEFFKNPTDFDVEAIPDVNMPNAASLIISENYQDMHMIHHVHNE